MFAVAAAHWSGSVHIARASRVSALIYLASILFWLLSHHGIWRYAVLDLFALAYFYRAWSSPDAQQKQFHFLMMCSYLVTTAFYTFRTAITAMGVQPFGMSLWWYGLASNLMFELELLFVAGYAFLYRRAKADKRKFKADSEQWLSKVRRLTGDTKERE